jgi:two-component system sensor histidine kinase GlrK
MSRLSVRSAIARNVGNNRQPSALADVVLDRQRAHGAASDTNTQARIPAAERVHTAARTLARYVRSVRGVEWFSTDTSKPSRLAWRLFWSHTVLATILLLAVAIMLSGLFGMNTMIAEVKNRYLTDFEEEERVHHEAWAIETTSRHGMLACERDDNSGAEVSQRLADATHGLSSSLDQFAGRLSGPMERAARAYQEFGTRILRGEVCDQLKDPGLDRERLLLDERLTDAWISKLRELRLAILERELSAQRLGWWASAAGVGLGVLSLLAAAVIARSMARGVTVPLSLLAAQARRAGEGEFSRSPAIDGPHEVAELSRELDRMQARIAEVSQLKQAFLGSVSHDLRTPLAHMREALNLLLDGAVGALSPAQERVAGLALRACEREIRLVSALLDLSRIRSGRPLVLMPGQHIDQIIANAIEHVRDAAPRVTMTLVAPSPVPRLSLDAVLVETALVNILSNAVAASASASGACVRIRRALTEEGSEARPGRWLQVLVEDEGSGVAPELREKIFEPFFSTKIPDKNGGSGLGLPLAREMIRAHGGELALVDRPGRGAAFALWLPLSSEGGAAPENEGSSVRILTSITNEEAP